MSVKKCKTSLGKDLYQNLRKKVKLSLKEIMFVAEYVTNGFNAGKAYQDSLARKGLKMSTCYTEGCLSLKRPKIKEAIKEVISSWLGEKKVKLERQIIAKLYSRAFYDPTIFYNPDGTIKFKDWEDVPEEWRCCIDSMEVKFYGKDADTKVIVLKLCDREKAMEKLSKYIELYKETAVHEVSLSEETVDKLGKIFDGKIEK